MNKLAAFIVFVVCLGHFRVAAQSTTVNYTGGGPSQPNVTLSDGTTAVPNGNTVRIGYFDAGFVVADNAADLDELALAWNEYDFTSITTIWGRPGSFADTPSSTDPLFDNQKIYLWIFKTTDNTAPDSDYGDVTEYGLYSSSLSNWIFPQASATPPANNTLINTSEVNQRFFGFIESGYLRLSPVAPVPEPALGAFVALGFGVFGLIAGRRKK